MADPLDKLSTRELELIAQGNLDELPEHVLSFLAGESGPPPKQTAPGRLLDTAAHLAKTIRPGVAGPTLAEYPGIAGSVANSAAFGIPGAISEAIPGTAGDVMKSVFKPKPSVHTKTADVAGYLLPGSGPAKLAAGASRAALKGIGGKVATKFLRKTTARAAGQAAAGAPFGIAELPEGGVGGAVSRAATNAAVSAGLSVAAPVVGASLKGAGRGISRGIAAIYQRGLGSSKPSTVGKLLTVGKRQKQVFERQVARIEERKGQRVAALRERSNQQLETLRQRNQAEVTGLQEQLTKASTGPEFGQVLAKRATKVQQQLVGEAGYARKVYDAYDERIAALEAKVRDDEALQFGAEELRTVMRKHIPTTTNETGRTAFVPRHAGDEEVLMLTEKLGTARITIPQFKNLLKQLRASTNRRVGGNRRVTPADHGRMQAVSEAMDFAGERVPDFAGVQSWYKGHARTLDEAFRLLRPRDSEFTTASRLQVLGTRPSAVRGAQLGRLKEKSAEVGTPVDVQADVDELFTHIRDLQGRIEQTKGALKSGQRALSDVHKAALGEELARAEEELKIAAHKFRQYSTSEAGRAAQVSEVPVGFMIPTFASGRPRVRTATVGKAAQLSGAAKSASSIFLRGLTPDFVKRRGVSRALSALFATSSGQQVE